MSAGSMHGNEPLRLHLDQVLDEVQLRVNTIRGSRDQMRTLLEAVLAVGRGLELPRVLRQVVETAVVLADAEYGALGVIGEDRKLTEFVPVGIPDEVRERIGALPQGRGVLGLLIRHPAPVRIAEISEHPDFHGFPEHHPPMHSFLGVPVLVRDEVCGNLYLTNKRSAKEFDTEDESVVSTLAVVAGVAVDNARLLAERQRRQAWPAAAGEVTSNLLSGRPQKEVLRLVIAHARRNVSADLGVILVPAEGTDGLRTALADGEGVTAHSTGVLLSAREGFLAAALSGCGAVVTSDIVHDSRAGADDAVWWAGFGPAVAVPMGTGRAVRGVLFVARHKGRPAFHVAETGALAEFAGHAAVAMELWDRRREMEQVTVLRERERIVHDLQDVVIQRLFASGLGLQEVQRFVEHPEAAERLSRTGDDLDTTIEIIQSVIFALHLSGESPEDQDRGGG
ncbi:Putative Hypoxia sensor histidine kinase response regulator DosT [Streptomyces hygroscopicus subsp. limoneus]|nr:Putative Hypoxia sensor histidine kinase response regulator DosT [Streptomyces hygroscopicus subsp. limoneus]